MLLRHQNQYRFLEAEYAINDWIKLLRQKEPVRFPHFIRHKRLAQAPSHQRIKHDLSRMSKEENNLSFWQVTHGEFDMRYFLLRNVSHMCQYSVLCAPSVREVTRSGLAGRAHHGLAVQTFPLRTDNPSKL